MFSQESRVKKGELKAFPRNIKIQNLAEFRQQFKMFHFSAVIFKFPAYTFQKVSQNQPSQERAVLDRQGGFNVSADRVCQPVAEQSQPV